MIVIYTFQWNYFNAKGKGGSRTLAIHLKDQAKDETSGAFSLEILYIFVAMSGLFVNVAALYGAASAGGALQVSLLVGGLFFVLVYREVLTSMRHIANRQYAKPLWRPLRLRPATKWWKLTRRWELWLLGRRIKQLSEDSGSPLLSVPAVVRLVRKKLAGVQSYFEKGKVRIINLAKRVLRYLTRP